MVQIRGCERIHTWLVFPNLLHRLLFVSEITFLPIWEGLLNVHIHQSLRNGLCSARSIDGQTCPMLGSIGSRMLLLTCRKLRYLLKCQLIVTIMECSPRCSTFPPRAKQSCLLANVHKLKELVGVWLHDCIGPDPANTTSRMPSRLVGYSRTLN
jgi:hypothetical protein